MEKYQSVLINNKDIRVLNPADPTGYDDINTGDVNNTIVVYEAGTLTQASIFSDNGVTPITQPFNADADGVFFFYSANGRYDIVVDEGLSTESKDEDVTLFDEIDSSFLESGDNNSELINDSGYITASDIRYSLLDNPLLHILKTNKLTETIAPNNQDSDLTWTRASAATYIDRYGILQTAAIDEPREEKEGFLIESSSTNNLLWSKDFSNVAWSKFTGTVTTDNATAPDETLTADSFTSTSLGAAVQQNFTGLIGSYYTFSVWLRSATPFSTRLTIRTSGVSTNTPINVTNDWQRFDVTHQATSTAVESIIGGFSDFPNSTVVEIWEAQTEESQAYSSNITTTSSPETRSLDNVSISYLNNVIFDAPFTFMTSFTKDSGFFSDVALFSNSDSNRPLLQITSTGSLRYFDGTNIIATPASSVTEGESKICMIYDGVDLLFYVDGLEILSINYTPALITSLATIFIGQLNNNTAHIDANMKDTRFYDFALKPQEVIFLS